MRVVHKYLELPRSLRFVLMFVGVVVTYIACRPLSPLLGIVIPATVAAILGGAARNFEDDGVSRSGSGGPGDGR